MLTKFKARLGCKRPDIEIRVGDGCGGYSISGKGLTAERMIVRVVRVVKVIIDIVNINIRKISHFGLRLPLSELTSAARPVAETSV